MTAHHGLSEHDVQTLKAGVKLALRPGQKAEILLFGSRSVGVQRPYSDIDLLLRGDGLTAGQVEAMRDAFEESDLPYKVDLVWEVELLPAYKTQVLAQARQFFVVQ
jgi:type I restriction enzyme S subunit